MPKVSIVVPNYNHERFLEKRLQSILSQSYQDWELIFVDDASTDTTPGATHYFDEVIPVRFFANDFKQVMCVA